MKKRLLLVLSLIAVFVCLFAIGASAEKIGGIEYTLNTTNKTATFAASNRTECTLTEIIIPETFVAADGETYTVTSIADRSIGHQDTGAGNKYVEYVYIPKTVTYLGAQLMRNCNALKKVKMDANVTKLSTADFWGCAALEELDLSGMTKLTTIGQIATSVSSLKTVKLPDSVTTINDKAFQSTGITSINLPSGLTSIGSNCFQSTKMQTLILPATLTSVSGAAFHSMSSVSTLVFANTSFAGWSTNVTFNGVNPQVIFFAGSDPTTLTNYYTQWASYSTKSYADYLKNPSAVGTKTIVYGTANCTVCSDVYKTAEEQVVFKDYLSGFSKGKLCTSCNNVVKTVESDAMFTFVGFSIPENANEAGFVVKYTVNNDAIAIYKELTGKDVAFGLYAATEDKLEGGDIFDEEGMPNEGALKAEVGSGFMILELKVAGFTTEEQKAEKLALGVYVETTFEENKEYSFLNQEIPAEGDKYFFVSYNDVLDLVK